MVTKSTLAVLEKQPVDPADRARSLRVLSYSFVENLNIELYRELCLIKNCVRLSKRDGFIKYRAFLEQTNGHPIYTKRPELAACRMFEQLPDAPGIKGPFIVFYEPRSSRTASYGNRFGGTEVVSIPKLYKGFKRTAAARPSSIPAYKGGEISTSRKKLFALVKQQVVQKFVEGQALLDDLMRVDYKAPSKRSDDMSGTGFVGFICSRGSGKGCLVKKGFPKQEPLATGSYAVELASDGRKKTKTVIIRGDGLDNKGKKQPFLPDFFKAAPVNVHDA